MDVPCFGFVSIHGHPQGEPAHQSVQANCDLYESKITVESQYTMTAQPTGPFS